MRTTFVEFLFGFVCGAGAGFVFAVVMDATAFVRSALYPILIASQAVPIIAISAALTIWLGFGLAPKLVIVALTVFFPVVVNVLDGLASVDRDMLNLAKSMGGSRVAIFRHIKLPATYTPLFSALKLSATFSVTGAVIGEWTASTSGGLGAYLLQANSRLEHVGHLRRDRLPRRARHRELPPRRRGRGAADAVAFVLHGAPLVAQLLAACGSLDRRPMSGERIRPQRPTIRDVARQANVSVGTVSSVINNRTVVAEETRRHVLRLIAELGYEPNSAAQTLKRGRISSIGIIVPDLKNPYFAAVAEGVERVAAGNDVLMVLCLTSAETAREEYYTQVLRTQRLDGVIYLSGTGLPTAALLRLSERSNVVFVDERLPGIEVPFVISENRAGARAVAAHVVAAGHERIGIVGGPPRLWTSEQRLAGYREAIAAAGGGPGRCHPRRR